MPCDHQCHLNTCIRHWVAPLHLSILTVCRCAALLPHTCLRRTNPSAVCLLPGMLLCMHHPCSFLLMLLLRLLALLQLRPLLPPIVCGACITPLAPMLVPTTSIPKRIRPPGRNLRSS